MFFSYDQCSEVVFVLDVFWGDVVLVSASVCERANSLLLLLLVLEMISA
jgi:hypothetical protein